MRFRVLLRDGSLLRMFELESPGVHLDKNIFPEVAAIEATDPDQVYRLCQNGRPGMSSSTGTWAAEPYVTLTEEGHERLCVELNNSLRSLSVGDIIIGPADGILMIAPVGFVSLRDDGTEFVVLGD